VQNFAFLYGKDTEICGFFAKVKGELARLCENASPASGGCFTAEAAEHAEIFLTGPSGPLRGLQDLRDLF